MKIEKIIERLENSLDIYDNQEMIDEITHCIQKLRSYADSNLRTSKLPSLIYGNDVFIPDVDDTNYKECAYSWIVFADQINQVSLDHLMYCANLSNECMHKLFKLLGDKEIFYIDRDTKLDYPSCMFYHYPCINNLLKPNDFKHKISFTEELIDNNLEGFLTMDWYTISCHLTSLINDELERNNKIDIVLKSLDYIKLEKICNYSNILKAYVNKYYLIE